MANEQAICPVWPADRTETLGEISRDELIWLYRHYHNVDVSDDISADRLALVRNVEKDFVFFAPILTGSEAFYRALYAQLAYVEGKPEYQWAANFITPDDHVLDVGCGFGHFQSYIPSAHFHGLDLNPASVAEANRLGRNVQARSVFDLAQQTPDYDVVTAFQVLEHVDNPRGFFQALVSCLKPGGLLIVSVPNLHGYMCTRENTPLNLPPHHVTWWSLRSLIALGDEEGVNLVDYDEEKLVSLADFTQSLFKHGLNTKLGRGQKLIRPGWFDRAMNWLFFQIGRLFPHAPALIAPNGHSIAVVYRKPENRTKD